MTRNLNGQSYINTHRPFCWSWLHGSPLSSLTHHTSELLGNMSNRTWETNEVVLPSIETLGYDFLAPYSLALFISALETGVIIVCFARFLNRRADAESWPIKLLVYFLTFASL